MPHNYFKRVSKDKLRKGDRIYYGDKQFGYYVRKQKSHATMGKSSVTPHGARKGQIMIAIWNPHALGSGGASKANVYLPKKGIKKAVRGYVRKPK